MNLGVGERGPLEHAGRALEIVRAGEDRYRVFDEGNRFLFQTSWHNLPLTLVVALGETRYGSCTTDMIEHMGFWEDGDTKRKVYKAKQNCTVTTIPCKSERLGAQRHTNDEDATARPATLNPYASDDTGCVFEVPESEIFLKTGPFALPAPEVLPRPDPAIMLPDKDLQTPPPRFRVDPDRFTKSIRDTINTNEFSVRSSPYTTENTIDVAECVIVYKDGHATLTTESSADDLAPCHAEVTFKSSSGADSKTYKDKVDPPTSFVPDLVFLNQILKIDGVAKLEAYDYQIYSSERLTKVTAIPSFDFVSKFIEICKQVRGAMQTDAFALLRDENGEQLYFLTKPSHVYQNEKGNPRLFGFVPCTTDDPYCWLPKSKMEPIDRAVEVWVRSVFLTACTLADRQVEKNDIEALFHALEAKDNKLKTSSREGNLFARLDHNVTRRLREEKHNDIFNRIRDTGEEYTRFDTTPILIQTRSAAMVAYVKRAAELRTQLLNTKPDDALTQLQQVRKTLHKPDVKSDFKKISEYNHELYKTYRMQSLVDRVTAGELDAADAAEQMLILEKK